MGGGGRFALQRTYDHLFDLRITQLAWLSGTRLIKQTVQSLFIKPVPPFIDRLNAGMHFCGNGGSGQSIASTQNNPRTHRKSLSGLPSPRPALQSRALLLAQ